ncbi:MAG: MCE family protein [Acidimicrobiales bacterium]|nr:MCE family protein [Acidimicrobiales bacterium]
MTRLRLVSLPILLALVASGCALLDRGNTYDVVAYFPRAVSVYESGAVQVLGLPAGEISDVEVVGDQVKVTMAIDDDIPVPMDVKAAIVPQSLIGERRVQLFPPFQEGDQVISDGYEISAADTVVPVEPDEALAALNEFLEKLDPNGLGRLIDNAATALDGQGENLGAALEELSKLVGNIEDNDDDIIAIAERFDDFTSTLLTREGQLAQALDDFAVVTDVLADERDDIELLVSSLADLSGDGLDLVSEHAVRLRTDVEILTRLTRSIDANLDGVQDLLDAGPALIDGFINAYDEDLKALNLRNNFSPLIAEALAPLFDGLGLPTPCVSILGTECPGGGLIELDDGSGAVEAEIERPTGPINDILGVLGTPSAQPASSVAPTTADDSNVLARFLGTFLGVGS